VGIGGEKRTRRTAAEGGIAGGEGGARAGAPPGNAMARGGGVCGAEGEAEVHRGGGAAAAASREEEGERRGAGVGVAGALVLSPRTTGPGWAFSDPWIKSGSVGGPQRPGRNGRLRSRHVSSIGRPKIQTPVRAP
jgi:hypothetical protein